MPQFGLIIVKFASISIVLSESFITFASTSYNWKIMEYKKRIADNLLQDKLDAIGAVLVEGPKVCGK